MEATCEINKIIKELQKASLDNNISEAELAEIYLDYLECTKKRLDATLHQFGLPQNKILMEKIASFTKEDKNGIWEKAVCNKARKYFDKAIKSETHIKQKENLEDAIRLLKDFTSRDKVNNRETYVLLAEAYLKRSRIIRPKGLTIPAKKKEAIEKGLKTIDKALEIGKDEDGHEKALRMKASLFIELNRLGEDGKEDIKAVLKDALDNGCKECTEKEDIKIAVLYSELTNAKNYLDAVVKSRCKNIAFEKARAYRELSQEAEFINEMKHVTNSLKKLPFSHPLWDDTVWYLKKLWKSDQYPRKDISLQLSLCLWQICQENEKDISSPLHIRWYWSRMRDLYDLAFLAAGDTKTKAIIADSLKSRPALQWNTWEELGKSDECIKAVIEAEAKALGGGYIIDYEEIKKKCKKSKTDEKPETPPLDIEAVPEGWIVTHFYLNQLEKQGYALIYNSYSKTWGKETFKYDELFNAYIEWQGNYNNLPDREKNESADRLLNLCETIGREMAFLFKNEIIPNESKVLFIPHDFLHRLPLHGAIKTGANARKKVFLENHASCYLPAWSLARGKGSNAIDRNYMIKNYNGHNFNTLIINHTWANINPAPPDNLDSMLSMSTPPYSLVVLCHGKADMVNPFNSMLLLNGDIKSCLDILNAGFNLMGSRIFLGACETDLVPPLTDTIDEHLSVSTAFLNHNAQEIVGTLWAIYDTFVDFIFSEIIEKPNLYKKIQALQKAAIENNKDATQLYKWLAFRAIKNNFD